MSEPRLTMRGYDCYGAMAAPVVTIEVKIDDSGNVVTAVVELERLRNMLDVAIEEALEKY